MNAEPSLVMLARTRGGNLPRAWYHTGSASAAVRPQVQRKLILAKHFGRLTALAEHAFDNVRGDGLQPSACTGHETE